MSGNARFLRNIDCLVATLFIATTFIATTALAQTPSLLVLSKSDHTVAIVDPANLQVQARIPSVPDPHEIIASSDGKTAYISNYGGGAYNTLTVVDLVERKSLPTIDLGPLHGPHGLVFAGGKVWFTAEANKVIGALRRWARGREFDVALAHGSHELTITAHRLGIPSATTFDYEWAWLQHQLGCRAATKPAFFSSRSALKARYTNQPMYHPSINL